MDGYYHYLVADMEHMDSSKILIQVIEAANTTRRPNAGLLLGKQ